MLSKEYEKKLDEEYELLNSNESQEYTKKVLLEMGKCIQKLFPGVEFELKARFKSPKSFNGKKDRMRKSAEKEKPIYDNIGFCLIVKSVSDDFDFEHAYCSKLVKQRIENESKIDNEKSSLKVLEMKYKNIINGLRDNTELAEKIEELKKSDNPDENVIRLLEESLKENEKLKKLAEILKQQIEEKVELIEEIGNEQYEFIDNQINEMIATHIMNKLMNKFMLSEIQAKSILDMRLRRLTGLERDKIESELNDLLEEINELKSILASNEKVMNIIKEEMLEIKKKYGDERRTSIDMTAIDFIDDESLIPVENIVITLTNNGYIKRTLEDNYKAQNRGGVGVKGMSTNEEDYVDKIISMTTHDYLMIFTNNGKVYRLKGYEIPLYSRQSKGLPIINLLPIDKGEKVSAMLKVENDKNDGFFVFSTRKGLVKRTNVREFENIRSNGKIAISLDEDSTPLIRPSIVPGVFI